MKKRAVLGLAGGVLVLAVAVSPSSAGRPSDPPSEPAFAQASDLPPAPRGGPEQPPYGYLPLHAREFGQAKEAANSRAGLRGGNRPGGGGGGGPTVTTYSNVTPSFNANYQTGLTPPDTTGAIGPDRYIEAINTQYAIYNRSGSLINGGSLSSLTGISGGIFGHNLSDPQMMWDAKTQRFYYAAVYYDSFFSDNGIAVGWSKTASPRSSTDFCKYAITFGGVLPDYPHLGDSGDFLLYGYNQFSNFASSYDGSQFVTLNKPPAGSNCPAASGFTVYTSGVLHNADSSLAATPIPANLVDDSNGAGYVVADADVSVTGAANFISLYTVTTNGNDANGIPIPKISGPTNVTVPSYDMPSNAPEKDSSNLIDTLDARFEAAVAAIDPAQGGKIAVWTAHAVWGGPGVEERWYEIDPTGGIFQSGAASSGSLFIWNGAISPDRANNGTTGTFGGSMAMSVSTSSADTYPAIQVVWKKTGSAQSGPNILVQSTGPNIDFSCSPCRWGDYSGASPDPAATGSVGKVWLANQYNIAGGSPSSTAWRTWVFAVTPS